MKINNIYNEALLYIINNSIGNNHNTTEHIGSWLEELHEFMVAWDSDLTKFHLELKKTNVFWQVMVEETSTSWGTCCITTQVLSSSMMN